METSQQLKKGIYYLNRVLSFIIIFIVAVVVISIVVAQTVNPLAYLLLLLLIPLLIIISLVSRKLKILGIKAKIREEWAKPEVLKKRDFQAISLLYQDTVNTTTPSGTIDDQTWKDLNLEKVFSVADRTFTDAGEAVLYQMFRIPQYSMDALTERSRVINVFQRNISLREEIQTCLAQLGHQYASNDLFTLLWGDLLPTNRLRIVLTIMAIAALLSITVPFIWSNAVLAIIPVGIFIANLFIHYLSRRKYRDLIYSFPCLLTSIRTAGKLAKLKTIELEQYRLNMERLHKAAAGVLAKARFLLPEKDAPASSPAEIMFEYLNIFFLLEVRSFYAAASEINRQKEYLKALYLAIGEMDALQSIASYRESLISYCEPEFIRGNAALEMKDARYPLLKHPVPATIHFQRNGIVITGSNMSGKSTFLRNIACNVILAQTLMTCTASAYRGTFFKVITSISRTDDVIAGKSFYFVEAERLYRIITGIDPDISSLCIVDELLSGTNSYERLKASDAIVRYLIKQNALVICATHDMELIDRLHGLCDLYHFSGTADDTGLKFDYMLKKGPATSQNAIELLEYLGYPQEIIDRTKEQ